ncbi:MAG: cytochrome c-type biogenesis protein CcmH, partial [Terriglobales bacterium]
QSFVQEYGTTVLANPTKQGFNLLAWVIPWVAAGFGLALVMFFVRRFRQAPQTVAGVTYPALQSQVQAQIEAELEAELGPKRKP